MPSLNGDAKKLTVHWNKPLVNYLGEEFNASATMTVELTGDGILLGLSIANSTRYRIGEVFFPLIGGIQGRGAAPEQLKTTQLVRPAGGQGVSATDIFRVFVNMSDFGDEGPEQYYAYPGELREPWMEFFAPKLNRSVYFGSARPGKPPEGAAAGTGAQQLGHGARRRQLAAPSELKGAPVGVSVCFADVIGAPAGKAYEATPMLISFHDGDWRQAKNIFMRRKETQ